MTLGDTITWSTVLILLGATLAVAATLLKGLFNKIRVGGDVAIPDVEVTEEERQQCEEFRKEWERDAPNRPASEFSRRWWREGIKEIHDGLPSFLAGLLVLGIVFFIAATIARLFWKVIVFAWS